MGRPRDTLRRMAADLLNEPAAAYHTLRAHHPPGDQERTTFRLTPAATSARDWLVEHLHISQRELFDRIPYYLDEAVRTYEAPLLEEVVGELEGRGERKTYVVSEHTVDRINTHAERLGLPRDALVSFALLGMQFLVERSTERARRRRAAFAGEVEKVAETMRRLREEAAGKLDPDDALQYRLGTIATDLEVLARQLTMEQQGGLPLARRP